MTETEAIRLFKCLSDKSRLQILKSLSMEDMYVERLAERLGITAPTVSFHMKKLSDAGAVTSYKSQYNMMHSLNKEIFKLVFWIFYRRNRTKRKCRRKGMQNIGKGSSIHSLNMAN